jgi:hypothetical protein
MPISSDTCRYSVGARRRAYNTVMRKLDRIVWHNRIFSRSKLAVNFSEYASTTMCPAVAT